MITYNNIPELKPMIKILGIGGAGNNAVNRMYSEDFNDVEFAICHTDYQKLNSQIVPEQIKLGPTLLEGAGTGNNIEKAKDAAFESMAEINICLHSEVKMLFITAGLGKGTGTGASIEIAKLAKEKGILCVAVLALPSFSEGAKINNQAREGLKELKKYVDSYITIDNSVLFKTYGELPLSECYSKADEVISTAVKGISELITLEGYVNLDFADVKTVLKQSGTTLIGGAEASGPDRASECIKAALDSPLLSNNNIAGASNILLNIVSGTNEITMDEVTEITSYIQEKANSDSNVIWGITDKESLGEQISITIVATGFPDNHKSMNGHTLTASTIESSYTIEDYFENPQNEKIISDLTNNTALSRKKNKDD